MIFELKKENIEELEGSFINKNEILNEFESNPFAKILLLKEDNEIIGYIYYSDIYDRLEINQFEINNQYRNKGFGGKAIDEINKKFKKAVSNS